MGDIDEVKAKLNIVDVIGARVVLKKAGRNFKGLCPFHSEKTPSFMVSADRQMWHCFGCGKGGSVIDFVMEYEHMDFVEALETLAEKAGVKLEKRASDTPENKIKQKIYEVNHLASEYFNFILTKHKLGEKAKKYLAERGVRDKTIDTFKLGYSPDSWEALKKYLAKKGYDEKILETAGLTVNSVRGGYDRFRGRVMFTLKDHRGQVVGFSGRLLDKNAKEAKYINTSDTPVYQKSHVLYGLDVTKDAIVKTGEAVVMEGEFDVISSFQEGISNAVAIKGSALTEGHLNLLKRYADRLILSLDSDVAGDAAARRGIEIAQNSGFDIRVASMPSGKDPDEAIRTDVVGFKKALKEAVPVFDYYISSALARFDKTTAYGKKKISDELLPVLSAVENPVVQAHYAKKLSTVLEVAEQAVFDGLKKLPKNISAKTEDAYKMTELPPKRSRFEKLEIYTLALILQTKTEDFFEEFSERIKTGDILNTGIRRIFELLRGYLGKTSGHYVAHDFLESLPNELSVIVDEAMLIDLSDFSDNEEILAREWMKTLRELRRGIIRGKMKNISTLLSSVDPENDPAGHAQLQNTLSILTDDLRALEKASAL